MRIGIGVLILCGLCAAQDLGKPAPAQRLWQISLVSLATAHIVDSHSSWAKCEANPFVAGSGGTFDARSLALKSAVYGGLSAFEFVTGRHHPSLYRWFSAVNFGVAGGLGALAAHNYSVHGPGIVNGISYSCK